MPKTFFNPGTPVRAAWLNAIQNLRFVDSPDQDGEYPAIRNESLANFPGQVRFDLYSFLDDLTIEAEFPGGTTRTITIRQGNTVDQYGFPKVISDTRTHDFAAQPDVVVFYNLITDTIVYRPFNTGRLGGLSVVSVPIARLRLLSAVSPVTVTDLRVRFVPTSPPIAQRPFGGFSEVDATGGGTSTGGLITCRNFTNTLPWTITSGFLHIKASGNVTINGTITVTPPTRGGGYGSGSIVDFFVFNTSAPGVGFGAAPTVNVSTNALPIGLTRGFGSGGSAGTFNVFPNTGTNTFDYNSGIGGSGGGVVIIEAVGTITINGTIRCAGGNGTNASLVVTAGNPTVRISGNSGGSGGSIQAKSLTGITIASGAVLDVRGGGGSSGVVNNSANQGVSGGCGAGGGFIILSCPLTGRNFPVNASGQPSQAIAPTVYLLNGGVRGLPIPATGTTTGYFGVAGGSSHAGAGGNHATTLAVPSPPTMDGQPGITLWDEFLELTV